MEEQEKIELLMLHVDEEASILEIFRAISRQYAEESPAQVQQWIIAKVTAMAEEGTLGFYVDEFGARDVVECDLAQAQTLLSNDEVWSLSSANMLHVFPQELF